MIRHASDTGRGAPTLYLARHCKTLWNAERRIQGSRDLPLSETGMAQAAALAPRLACYGFDRIVSSPYRRAVQTARIYAGHLHIPLDLHRGLRELNHGRWEGRSIDSLLTSPDSGYARWLANPLHVPIPGGTETVIAAQNRVVDALIDIVQTHPGRTLLVILHKHIRALLQCRLQGSVLGSFGALIDDGIDPVPVPEPQIALLFQPV